jgi:hypothetical protein
MTGLRKGRFHVDGLDSSGWAAAAAILFLVACFVLIGMYATGERQVAMNGMSVDDMAGPAMVYPNAGKR